MLRVTGLETLEGMEMASVTSWGMETGLETLEGMEMMWVA
jgi:hypothetical protein